jgi:(p)ppGpp synthase/HD superfamily hydrolase
MNSIGTPAADLLMLALQICLDVHQADRDRRGMPYVLHPIRVMEKQETVDRKIVALLHDALEEHPEKISASEIRRYFGRGIERSVLAITKRQEETWDRYISRVIKDRDAAMVKLADLEDNMHPRRLDKKASNKSTDVYLDAYERICDRYGITTYLNV